MKTKQTKWKENEERRQSERRTKAQEGNNTTSQTRRQTSWNLVRVGKVMRAGYRLGGVVGGCSSGVVWEDNILGSELSECTRTHTLFEYPLGKPLEATRRKEQQYCIGIIVHNLPTTSYHTAVVFVYIKHLFTPSMVPGCTHTVSLRFPMHLLQSFLLISHLTMCSACSSLLLMQSRNNRTTRKVLRLTRPDPWSESKTSIALIVAGSCHTGRAATTYVCIRCGAVEKARKIVKHRKQCTG